MSRLDNIYNTFVNTEDYAEFPEKESAEKSLYDYLENNGLKEIDFEPYVTELSSENMRQGFKHGFRYAVDILVGREVLTV